MTRAAAADRGPAPRLRDVQRWLAEVMRHRRTAAVAVRSPGAREIFPPRRVLAGHVVAPNDRMSVTARLQVYNDAYLARLLGVLASDYAGLQHLLGEERFRELGAAYVDRHPSRHPNLNRFGAHLPEFVARRRNLPQRPFAAGLARLELCIALAFDAPAFTPVDAARLAAVQPADWPHAKLACNPSLQLCTFRHPVNAWYVDFREGRAPRPPRPRRTHVAVFRREDRVWRADLAPAAHAVLAALAAGRPLATALDRARGDPAVGDWFRTWAADGLFTGVVVRRRR